MNRIVEHDPIIGHTYVLSINHDPISFEMTLFNYMNKLEEVDEHARVFMYKDEYGIMVSSYRNTDCDIVLDESDMSDSFLQYTLVNGNVKKRYESLFDIIIPSKKTMRLTKNDNELVLKVV